MAQAYILARSRSRSIGIAKIEEQLNKEEAHWDLRQMRAWFGVEVWR